MSRLILEIIRRDHQTTKPRRPRVYDGTATERQLLSSTHDICINGRLGFSMIDVAYHHGLEDGTESLDYQESVKVGPDLREIILAPLENGTVHHVAVQALSSDGDVTFTSCEIFAMPHVRTHSRTRRSRRP